MMGMSDIDCMKLALQLAASGRGYVAPNPMVGAVLCHQGRVIGQGYHQQFGGPHAEVNCFQSVHPSDEKLITQATLFVTLEPCSHFGKTPPCADLIIKKNVFRVVVASIDPNEKVRGEGIRRLEAAGIQVEQGLLQKEATELNARFFTFHQFRRPYITIKWAETCDGYIGTGTKDRMHISGSETNKLVHEWRAAEDAILVGTGTAMLDNPSLTVRFVNGRSPLRVILQTSRPPSADLKMFQDGLPVVVINSIKEGVEGNAIYVKMSLDNGPEPLMDWLYRRDIQGLMIEGGQKTLQYFLDSDCWDELKIITNTAKWAGKGIQAPAVPVNAVFRHIKQIDTDRIVTYKKK
jgi:diaminohydroxyphosphoribosylaminopyrimidine deaminase/5-amino-6-(5-phosphoribosylamino)uracil reductase